MHACDARVKIVLLAAYSVTLFLVRSWMGLGPVSYTHLDVYKRQRQQVRHGHITVNGRRVDIPSFRVKPGDLVAVAPKAADLLVIKSALISNERVQVPAWLEVDIEKLQGSVLALPQRDQIDLDIREQLIVELYSK